MMRSKGPLPSHVEGAVRSRDARLCRGGVVAQFKRFTQDGEHASGLMQMGNKP
jgi:hypothetical protein